MIEIKSEGGNVDVHGESATMKEILEAVRGLYDGIKRESTLHAALLRHAVTQDYFWEDDFAKKEARDD